MPYRYDVASATSDLRRSGARGSWSSDGGEDGGLGVGSRFEGSDVFRKGLISPEKRFQIFHMVFSHS